LPSFAGPFSSSCAPVWRSGTRTLTDSSKKHTWPAGQPFRGDNPSIWLVRRFTPGGSGKPKLTGLGGESSRQRPSIGATTTDGKIVRCAFSQKNDGTLYLTCIDLWVMLAWSECLAGFLSWTWDLALNESPVF
jgi:hypothetical protein